MPIIAYSWKRLLLTFAEFLVWKVCEGDHSYGYLERGKDAAEAVREFRQTYYAKPSYEAFPAR